MKEIALKKYDESDLNTIVALTEPVYRGKFNGFPKQTISVIVEDEAVAGWVHLSVPDNFLHSGFLFVYVAPDFRRNKIGTYAYRQSVKIFQEIGCGWWSSYPEFEGADSFALSVGFDYTNTNSFLVYNGDTISVSSAGIRMCKIEDYPSAPEIWSREYAEMHTRIGLPYKKRELSDAEKREDFEQFCKDLNNYFVIEADRKIVGIGSLFDDNSGIGSIAVDSAYSGKGYGTRLAAFLTNECIKRGCSSPCLYCESGNKMPCIYIISSDIQSKVVKVSL